MVRIVKHYPHYLDTLCVIKQFFASAHLIQREVVPVFQNRSAANETVFLLFKTNLISRYAGTSAFHNGLNLCYCVVIFLL